MSKKLTTPQRDMLATLASQTAWWTAADLLRSLYNNHTTTQGVHQTAASLVRNGWAEKRPSKSGMQYTSTRDGKAILEEEV
jgi:hypothetical protein